MIRWLRFCSGQNKIVQLSDNPVTAKRNRAETKITRECLKITAITVIRDRHGFYQSKNKNDFFHNCQNCLGDLCKA